MKIGIQGGKGSFHEEAAFGLYGDDARLEYIATFHELFDALESGRIDICVVAIANNAIGFIHEPYSLLTSSRAQKFRISGETYVRVEHQLLGLPGSTLSQIKEVHSQAPAIGQCGDFIEARLPTAIVIEQDDTAKSAELVSIWRDPTKAAIASRTAGQLHNLVILSGNIQNDPDNLTRFVVLQRRHTHMETNGNKSSAILHTPQSPGSLLKALDVFYGHNVNLSTLHSAFIPNSAFEMKFFIEFEAGTAQTEIIAQQLMKAGCNMELLGSYNKAITPIDVNAQR